MPEAKGPLLGLSRSGASQKLVVPVLVLVLDWFPGPAPETAASGKSITYGHLEGLWQTQVRTIQIPPLSGAYVVELRWAHICKPAMADNAQARGAKSRFCIWIWLVLVLVHQKDMHSLFF